LSLDYSDLLKICYKFIPFFVFASRSPLMKLLKTYTAILFAMIFWSFSFIWFKIANENYLPMTIIFFRLVVASIILTVYLAVRKEFVAIRREDRKLFLILSFFEPFLYFIGESNGLTYVTSTTGSVLISTIPAVVALAAWIFFGERLRIINYAGILLSFIGIVVFVIDRNGVLAFNVRGLLLLGLAVCSAAGFNLILVRLLGTYSPVFIVNVQNIVGVVLFLPIFLFTDFRNFFTASHTLWSLLPILELALFASCGAFILFAYSVKQLGVSRVNPFTNIIPVFTAVFSFFLLGNILTLQNMVGMVLVMSGIFLTQLNGRRKKVDEALIITGKTA
ncbi:MAG: DMT family transporter, partial [Bacteroidales bacterium]